MRALALPVSLGMWGSAFAASLDEIFMKTAGFSLSFLDLHRGHVNITGEVTDPDPPPPCFFPAIGSWQSMRKGWRRIWLSHWVQTC